MLIFSNFAKKTWDSVYKNLDEIFFSPGLRRKLIFWGWTWTGSLPLIEDNRRFSKIFIVFSWYITTDGWHQRSPSFKYVCLDTQRSKGVLTFCLDTLQSWKQKLSYPSLELKKLLKLQWKMCDKKNSLTFIGEFRWNILKSYTIIYFRENFI